MMASEAAFRQLSFILSLHPQRTSIQMTDRHNTGASLGRVPVKDAGLELAGTHVWLSCVVRAAGVWAAPQKNTPQLTTEREQERGRECVCESKERRRSTPREDHLRKIDEVVW